MAIAQQNPNGVNDADRGVNDADRGVNDADRGVNDADRGVNDADRGVNDADRIVPGAPGDVMFSFAPLVKEASPAVVNIFTKSFVSNRGLESFFSPFEEDQERRDHALGSGVIVTADGTVVTNAHVIEGADEIEVYLANNDIYFADVLFKDKRTDVAILKLRAEEEQTFPMLSFGDSDQVQVGDFVLAIGNPFGIGQSTSMGIVSALNRTEVDVIETGSFIQTDAAINPGNSGGALIDIKGQLIGINSAILSRSGSSAGIGWAIPSNFIKTTVDAVEASDGKLIRPWIAMNGRTLTRQLAATFGLPDMGGVVVDRLVPGSPLEEAGLREGDIISSIDGKAVDSIEALRFILATKLVGDSLTLTVFAQDDTIDLTVDLIAPPEIPPKNPTLLEGRHPLEGATIINVSPAVVEEFNINITGNGVMVLEVPSGSIAGRLNRLRKGDVIIRMQDEAVNTVDDVVRLTSQRTRRWTFELVRNGRVIFFRTTF